MDLDEDTLHSDDFANALDPSASPSASDPDFVPGQELLEESSSTQLSVPASDDDADGGSASNTSTCADGANGTDSESGVSQSASQRRGTPTKDSSVGSEASAVSVPARAKAPSSAPVARRKGSATAAARRRSGPRRTAAAPRLSTNPYLNFMSELRQQLSDVTQVDITRQGSRQWRCMSMEEKRPYYEMAARARNLQPRSPAPPRRRVACLYLRAPPSTPVTRSAASRRCKPVPLRRKQRRRSLTASSGTSTDSDDESDIDTGNDDFDSDESVSSTSDRRPRPKKPKRKGKGKGKGRPPTSLAVQGSSCDAIKCRRKIRAVPTRTGINQSKKNSKGNIRGGNKREVGMVKSKVLPRTSTKRVRSPANMRSTAHLPSKRRCPNRK